MMLKRIKQSQYLTLPIVSHQISFPIVILHITFEERNCFLGFSDKKIQNESFPLLTSIFDGGSYLVRSIIGFVLIRSGIMQFQRRVKVYANRKTITTLSKHVFGFGVTFVENYFR